MQRLRMVATDLDGTLVRDDGSVSPRTVAAVRACRAAGVHVVYVTGRPPRWMQAVVDQTGHGGAAICGNGAVVVDLDDDHVRSAHLLTVPDLHAVVDRLRALMPAATFAVETLEGFRRLDTYVARWDAGTEREVGGSVGELVRDDPGVLKLLCRDESRLGDEMLALARPALDGLAHVTHSNPDDCLIEVSALGVSKAATLAALAHELGVDRADVVAFGDMPNDVEMLTWAGRGYAMTDGHPEAVAAADALAPPCLDDGVAQVLEALLAQATTPS